MKLKQTLISYSASSAMRLLLGLSLAAPAVVAQAATSLPVYHVTQSGATSAQAATLATQLGINTNQLVMTNGEVLFVSSNYLSVPMLTVTDPTIISNLSAITKNEYPSIPLRFQTIDFNALTNLPVLNSNTAVALFSNALNVANLIPGLYTNGSILGTPVPDVSRFNVVYTNSLQQVLSISQVLSTEISYDMYETNGFPLTGPGMQVQASFDGAGNATRLLYAARQLEPGPQVQIISAATAQARAAGFYPSNALVTVDLEYICPPFRPWPPPPGPWSPTNVLPWYVCRASMMITNPSTGVVAPLKFKPRFIPATDDSRFVPSLNLTASSLFSTQVVASVSVSGGTPPYTYSWGGSNPTVATNSSSSFTYTPAVRLIPPTLNISRLNFNTLLLSWLLHPNGPGPDPAPDAYVLETASSLNSSNWTRVTTGPLQTNQSFASLTIPLQVSGFLRLRLTNPVVLINETISLSVMDASGTFIQAATNITVSAPVLIRGHGPGSVCYGCESPADPGEWTQERVGWQQGMSTAGAGGGAESFCWMGTASWPGDFIEPVPPGTLPASAWIYGDADYSNWGVNAANLVLINGDANPDVMTYMQPGARLDHYPTSRLFRPGYPSGTVGLNFDTTANYYNVDYRHSWGPIGPNDRLDWLCGLLCEMLDPYNGDGMYVTDRWGPALNGLHILTGFSSEAAYSAGHFPKTFAEHLLGVHAPAQTICQAWWSAARGDNIGTPAAMGPIGPAGVTDVGDYYWGKGSVGPTIAPSQVTGYWYHQGPNPP